MHGHVHVFDLGGDGNPAVDFEAHETPTQALAEEELRHRDGLLKHSDRSHNLSLRQTRAFSATPLASGAAAGARTSGVRMVA